ncbi:MAG: NAD(P)H-hydrate epimerase, partial [Woeseiaceae bacterium]
MRWALVISFKRMFLNISQYNQSVSMWNVPHTIDSGEGVREVDRAAIEDVGIPGYTLMTSAAMEALDEAFSIFPDAKRWEVVCGAGNNAGDGYVLARLAAQQGVAVEEQGGDPADQH